MKQKTNHKFIKYIVAFLLIGVETIFFTGCWDKVEIDKRAFVLGLGIDNIGEEFSLTCSIPNLPVLSGQESGDETKFIKNGKGKTLTDAYEKIASRLDKKLNFEHIEVIVLGKSIFERKTNIQTVLDILSRDPSYSLKVPILFCDSALKILQIKPEGAGSVGGYISDIYSFNSNLKSLELGDLFTQMSNSKGNVIIPIVKEGDKDLKIEGAAVIKNYIYFDKLSEEEVKTLQWIKGDAKNTKVIIDYMGESLVYNISSCKNDYKFELDKDDNLIINITINTEGDISEYIKQDNNLLYNSVSIENIEQLIGKTIKDKIEKLISKAQTNFKIDIVGLQDKLKIKSRSIYLKTKDDWNKVFTMANINVKVNTDVRRIGDIK